MLPVWRIDSNLYSCRRSEGDKKGTTIINNHSILTPPTPVAFVRNADWDQWSRIDRLIFTATTTSKFTLQLFLFRSVAATSPRTHLRRFCSCIGNLELVFLERKLETELWRVDPNESPRRTPDNDVLFPKPPNSSSEESPGDFFVSTGPGEREQPKIHRKKC